MTRSRLRAASKRENPKFKFQCQRNFKVRIKSPLFRAGLSQKRVIETAGLSSVAVSAAAVTTTRTMAAAAAVASAKAAVSTAKATVSAAEAGACV